MVTSGKDAPQAARAAEEAPTALLVRTPNWLGDLLVSTSFIQAALQCFPAARVDLVVRRGLEDLPLPHRGTILTFDRHAESAGAFGSRLKGRGYSHLFVLPPSFSAAWMAFRSRVPRRIGYRGQARGWLLRPAHDHRHPPRSVHLAQEYLDLLRPWMQATAAQFPARLALPPGWAEAHRPAELAAQAPFVLLAPGAEYGPAKQWPGEYYRETAVALHGAGWRVVLVGLAKERALAENIVQGLPEGLNLCGKTGLKALTALLAGAALLISNDSGAMHLAAALGLPQLALFGSTNPDWTAPLNPRAELLYRAEPCSPCYARVCPLGHLRCLVDLRPEGVIARALQLLERSAGSQ